MKAEKAAVASKENNASLEASPTTLSGRRTSALFKKVRPNDTPTNAANPLSQRSLQQQPAGKLRVTLTELQQKMANLCNSSNSNNPLPLPAGTCADSKTYQLEVANDSKHPAVSYNLPVFEGAMKQDYFGADQGFKLDRILDSIPDNPASPQQLAQASGPSTPKAITINLFSAQAMSGLQSDQTDDQPSLFHLERIKSPTRQVPQ